ncbi:MAG TPA: Flp pilus assembly protein CpaB [Dehalococcoidia bacterium]|nr:Flp pilus assembly protein CpaB [Dehalococcoidia bacterium]
MIKNLAIGGGSNRTLLLLALLLGLIAAVLIGVYLSSLEDDDGTVAPAETRVVVVAAIEVPPLTPITPEMLTTRAIPEDLALLGGFTSIEDVIGQKTQVTLVPGEQVIQSKIISPDTATDQFGLNAPLSYTIPDGMRGFALQVSAVGAANGLVRPGDRVDVIFSGSLEGFAQGGEEGGDFTAATACYMGQSLQVLAWDATITQTTSTQTTTTQTTSGSDAAVIAASDTNTEASSATLAVSPEQAWQFAAVQKAVNGGNVERQLWVSLRPFGDSSVRADLPTCSVAVASNPVPGS